MKFTKLHPDAKVKGKIEFDDKCVKPTGKFRLSYPSLFEPKEYKGKKSWSIQMLYEKDSDLSELHVAAQNAAIEKWGSDVSKWPSKKIKSKKTGKLITKSLLNNPFRDGDIEKPDKEEYEGMIFIGASCAKRAPEVLSQKRKIITEDDGSIKAGDYCRAKIVASAYDVEGSVGVKFTLLAIQKLETGEALGGGGSSRDDFEDADEDEAEDMEDEEENEDEDSEEEEDSEDEEEDEEDEEEEVVVKKKKKATKKTSKR
jgi:cobalamin biosynthesis protein CobT